MAKSKTALINKFFLVPLGAVLLAAIGEGVWEFLLKPISARVVIFFLSVSTFGFESLQDRIYKEIAIGQYERVGLQNFIMVFFLAALVPWMLSFSMILRMRSRISREPRLRRVVTTSGERLEGEAPNQGEDIASRLQRMKGKLDGTLLIGVGIAALVFPVLFFTFLSNI